MSATSPILIAPVLTSPSNTTIDSYETARSSITSYCTALSSWEKPSTILSVDEDGFEIGGDEKIIVVVGPTGAGKSTFVKSATGSEDAQIGHTLRVCTQHIEVIRCFSPLFDRDIVFVDTPGFDGIPGTDAKFLEEFADLLEKIYRAGAQLSGILYLHRVTDKGMSNTFLSILDVFRQSSSEDIFPLVRFVTTHWDLLEDHNQGIENEKRLREKYWHIFLREGPQMHRFGYSYSSAWQIIDSLPSGCKPLRIQGEMVNEHRSLRETSAARSLFSWLHSTMEALKHVVHRSEKPAPKASSADTSKDKKRERSSGKSKEYKGIIRRRPRRASTLSTCSASTVAVRLETDSVPCNPPGPYSMTGSTPHTTQRPQTTHFIAPQAVTPFEDVVKITLKIWESLNEMSNDHDSLLSLMNNLGLLLSVINDKYSPAQGYPNSVVDSLQGIYQQLVNIRDIVTRLKNCKSEPQNSSILSSDEQCAIGDCRETVTSALAELKNSTMNLPKIIAVMGSSGVGKSTFIKAATRTADGKLPSLMDDVVLVDTPGLDDAFEGDVKILKEVAKWLSDTYPSGIKLFGILFLHSIMDQRITDTVLRNLDMFQNLCNSPVLPSIILVTTNWDRLNDETIYEGDVHDQQLRTNYWRPLLNNGSKMLRFENTCFSAWDIINSFRSGANVKGKEKLYETNRGLGDGQQGGKMSRILY